jgi:flavin reductase (DIM6/NTAB) family NADH-FMN oxidoreductase RutF
MCKDISMFWKTNEPHGLDHNPFKSCVAPRPIGWISSISPNGYINLAPYSFFNAVGSEPPMVMFSSTGAQPRATKDTVKNIESTGEFVCNMVTWNLRNQMNATSAPAPADVNEFELAELEMEPSQLVKPPRVKAAPIHMECNYIQTVKMPCDMPGGRNVMIIGQVIGIQINDEFLVGGKIDIESIQPLARMGYQDYSSVEKIFTLKRPIK